MTNTIYFGSFSGYEEYYAVGSTAEEVKRLLWRMYANNFYGRPTKEDRRVFESEAWIRKLEFCEGLGYNTMCGENYTIKGNKLQTAKEVKER